MDLRYLRFTILLFFLEENSCSKKRYYQCTYHKELFFKLFDKRDSEEIICWDSQMHDSARIFLTQKYNDYRREVARGTCPSCYINEKYQYMCEMKWHWILEKKAQELQQERNFSKRMAALPVNEIISNEGSKLGERFIQIKSLEYATTSFLLDELVDVEEISYVKRFSKFLRIREINIFNDWATHFRRQFVTFFGCSIAVMKVIEAKSAYTALDEKIKNGDRVLLMTCVFASPIPSHISDTFQNESYEHIPTLKSCRSINSFCLTGVRVENGLCSFRDKTDMMAIFTPCQVYYPHTYFADMLNCPDDIPSYWSHYKLLEELNYTHLTVHLTDGAKLQFTLKSFENKTTVQLPISVAPLRHPFEAILSPKTTESVLNVTISNGLNVDKQLEFDVLSDSTAHEYKWRSEKKRRAAEILRVGHYLAMDTPFTLFNVSQPPLPGKPEQRTVYLSPIAVADPFDTKYCIIVILFYFIILFTFFLLLSLIAKYYIERKYFRT